MSETPVDIQLFIVHPAMTQAEISDALGLEAHFAHGVGDARRRLKEGCSAGNTKVRGGGTASGMS
jgi:hypothetical protein